MPSIAVISNPNALRTGRSRDMPERMRAALGDEGLVIETEDVGAIAAAGERCVSNGVEILAIGGGDGTLHHTLTHLYPLYEKAGREFPSIVLLRGGTMNTVANGLKALRGTPLEIITHVVDKRRRGERFRIAYRHALNLNDGAQLGFLFGIGLPAGFLQAYYDGRGTGPAKGAYVLARLALSALVRGRYARRIMQAVPAFVAGDGRESPYERYTTIFASTVTEIGLGFSPFSRTLDREDHFQILASAMSPASYVMQLRQLYTGAPLHGPLFDEVVEEAVIEIHRDAPYMFDGDVKTGLKSFRLRAGPRVGFIQD